MRSLLSFAVILFFINLPGLAAGNRVPVPGAWQIERYRSIIEGKTIALVANQTSMVGNRHLADTLVSLGFNLKLILSPEHGFRIMADAGETVQNGRDLQTGVQVISLYGSHMKPTREDLNGIDIVIFDVQDVGARFYTYISTLHYVVEACAENKVKCLILDRPNPNGFYFDGNIPDSACKSFVGMDPVPVVHGMTVGEYALMINGEGWLRNKVKCDISVITVKDYDHRTYYTLPVKPSPNLPNQNSVYLYPSICFFEGTCLSLGRGTSFPFQVFGSPEMPDKGFSFTPDSVSGSKNPPLKGKKCYGTDLRDAISRNIVPKPELNLDWIIGAYNDFPDKNKFFTPYFDVLAGGPALQKQIRAGMNSRQIRESWKAGLETFSKIRSRYLLYKE
jgi:uncharacterized protein YbbC (DUF1343 family)